jgi:hypothetical protein
MPSVREAIKEQNRLARMRMGQEAPDFVDIPSMPGVRAVQVPLLEREAQAGIIRAADIDVPDNSAGLQARNRIAIESDVWHSLREIDDPSKHVFESIDEMVGEEGLDPGDIDHLADNLRILMDYSSPALDGFSDKELDDLKKVFAETDWSALTGKRWAALKLCVSILFPELLQARSLGTGSTDSSTPTSAEAAST